MAWVTPKTNWVSNDYYNYTDLNRVETNIAEVRSYLISIGYEVTPIDFITNRTNLSYDLTDSLNRIEDNLDAMRCAFITPLDWVDTYGYIFPTDALFPSEANNPTTLIAPYETLYPAEDLFPFYKTVWSMARSFTHSDANRWEQNTNSLYNLAQLAYQSFRYSGTFNSGQVIL